MFPESASRGQETRMAWAFSAVGAHRSNCQGCHSQGCSNYKAVGGLSNDYGRVVSYAPSRHQHSYGPLACTICSAAVASE
eukprot:3402916-Amphidinium_carterae.1